LVAGSLAPGLSGLPDGLREMWEKIIANMGIFLSDKEKFCVFLTIFLKKS
jgi:hypothetical protein